MKKNGFAPIIILILLVLVGVGAYYFGNLKNKIVPVASVQPSSSPLAKPTTDPTANWKTYTDRKDNFSFMYPGKFQYLTLTNGVVLFFDDVTTYSSCQKDLQQDIKDKSTNMPCVLSNFTHNGFQNFTQSEYQNFLKSRIDPKDFTDSQGRVWQTDQVFGQSYNFQAVANISNKYYFLSFQASPSSYTDIESKNFFDQILSTFKFTK